MTALGTSGGATATNTGRADLHRATFKDFHLQLKYRATATSQQRRRAAARRRPGRDPRQRHRGDAQRRDRRPRADARSAQAKPVREWNTLDVIAYGDRITSPPERRRGRERDQHGARPEGTIGLENAGNNLMYADVRIKALDARTRPRRRSPSATSARRARRSCRARRSPPDYDCADEQDLDRVRRDARFSTATRPLHVHGHRHATPPATRPSSSATTASSPTRPRRSARRHRPGDARADARRARELRRVPAGRRARVHRDHDRERRQHRRRRDADGLRPGPPGQRRVRAPAAAAGRRSRPRRLERPGLQRPRPRSRSDRRSAPTDALRTGTYSQTLTFTVVNHHAVGEGPDAQADRGRPGGGVARRRAGAGRRARPRADVGDRARAAKLDGRASSPASS